ncbi:4-hydroxy-tetrahydrodipicolinate synthase [Proteinivorax hydrogeniformans]|uniref:4-hydroxy-tetrahydrodipicolinate synthase n=1 Tax=Proteinivorax hydrogeniformans TaxID=1826727 RepID=A0AAU8HRP1_9FIRM
MSIFKGSGVALVTPFKDGKVNYEKLEELINWHISNSTDAIIVCGTTGESATLSTEEKKQVITFAVEKTKGRVPLIAGTGGNNTEEVVKMSKFAESQGADGLLIVTPYYNKTTQRGIVNHYFTISDAVDVPIILYNVPGRTGLNIEPKTVAYLAERKNIIGIKEASADISQVAQIANLCPEGFAIYSGNDDQIVPLLSLGGAGVISVVANILPKETHDMVQNYLDGDTDKARDIQLKMLNVIDAMFIETNPIPVKTALNMMGMDVGELRQPLIEMEKQNRDSLAEALRDIGLEIKE